MSKVVLCPFCRKKVDLAMCPVVATIYDGGGGYGKPAKHSKIGTTPVSGAASYGEHFGQPVLRPVTAKKNRGNILERTIAALDPSDLAPVANYGLDSRDLPARACWECGTPLPDELGRWPIHTIGIVGTRGSGKSHFLAAMVKEGDERQQLRRWGFDDFSLDPLSSDPFYKTYRPTFHSRSVLKPTTEADSEEAWRKPFVIKVQHASGQNALLLFHDIAGETFVDHRKRTQFTHFLDTAAGIIFLIDPLMIEKIAERLPLSYASTEYINQALLIRACVAKLGTRAAITPLAITLSKSDLIEAALPKNADKIWFRRPPSSDEELAIKEMGYIDAEVQRLLNWAEASDVLAISGKLGPDAPVSFHAVAPIGYQPDPSLPRQEHPFEPLRCLDPLIAVLACLFPGVM